MIRRWVGVHRGLSGQLKFSHDLHPTQPIPTDILSGSCGGIKGRHRWSRRATAIGPLADL